MTIKTLREIASTSGLTHAEYCVEQAAHSLPRARIDRLYAELARLISASR